MKIDIQTIPHAQQRYDTGGDWWWEGDTLHIRVSQLGDYRFEFLCAIHEYAEAMLCNARGITEAEVDTWDTSTWVLAGIGDEPGDDPRAPYYREHQAGIMIERIMAMELGVDWATYDRAYERLPKWVKPAPQAAPKPEETAPDANPYHCPYCGFHAATGPEHVEHVKDHHEGRL